MAAADTSDRCVGYGEKGEAFDCPNRPGTPWTKVWCPKCDERRKAGITDSLAALRVALMRTTRE